MPLAAIGPEDSKTRTADGLTGYRVTAPAETACPALGHRSHVYTTPVDSLICPRGSANAGRHDLHAFWLATHHRNEGAWRARSANGPGPFPGRPWRWPRGEISAVTWAGCEIPRLLL